MDHVRARSYLILTILSTVLALSYGQCPDNKANVLSCEQTLIDLVTSRLAPYGKTFHTIDLNNATEGEWLAEKTKEVVCSASNAKYVSCLLSNITSCPQLANDSDVTSTWIASLLAQNSSIFNSPSSVCAFFNETVCSYKEEKFTRCYISMVGEVLVENADYDENYICQRDRRDNLTCMVENYRQCYNYFNFLDNTNIATGVRVMMLENQWENFNSGTDLCDCYQGSACYEDLKAEINASVTPATSVSDLYTKTITLSEILCRNISRVNCSVMGRQQVCQNVLKDFTSSRTKIDVYKSAVDSVCTDVLYADFKSRKDCVVEKLADVYHPCIVQAEIPIPPSQCGDVRKLYACVQSALNGQCNGNWVRTTYDIIRLSLGNVPVCDVKNDGKTIYMMNVTFLLAVSCLLLMFKIS